MRRALPGSGARRGFFMARIQLADVAVGDCFRREERWWTVAVVHGNVKKGSETSQSKIVLQDLLTGARKEVRVKSAEKVETVELTTQDCAVVRVVKGVATVAPTDGGDEISLALDGLAVHYVQPGMKVLLRLLDDEPLRIDPPKHVKMRVKAIPPRADQAAETKRIAVLDNGRKVKVPSHVEEGVEIVVRTSDETYVGVGTDDDAD